MIHTADRRTAVTLVAIGHTKNLPTSLTEAVRRLPNGQVTTVGLISHPSLVGGLSLDVFMQAIRAEERTCVMVSVSLHDAGLCS